MNARIGDLHLPYRKVWREAAGRHYAVGRELDGARKRPFTPWSRTSCTADSTVVVDSSL